MSPKTKIAAVAAPPCAVVNEKYIVPPVNTSVVIREPSVTSIYLLASVSPEYNCVLATNAVPPLLVAV